MDQVVFSFFQVGRSYSPTHAFKRLGSSFTAGEVLIFKRAVFGAYDDVYFYEFTPIGGGATKSWFPLKEEGEEACTKYFLEVA